MNIFLKLDKKSSNIKLSRKNYEEYFDATPKKTVP